MKKALNLNGRSLVSAVVPNWPFYGTTDLGNGTLIPESGIDVEIINVLADKLNFTYVALYN